MSVASLEIGAEATQLELGLDGAPPDLRDAAAGAVDAVRSRFGEGAVGPGSLVTAAGLQIGRPGGNRWAPVSPEEPPSPAVRDPGALP